jgi:hypothetical protein
MDLVTGNIAAFEQVGEAIELNRNKMSAGLTNEDDHCAKRLVQLVII